MIADAKRWSRGRDTATACAAFLARMWKLAFDSDRPDYNHEFLPQVAVRFVLIIAGLYVLAGVVRLAQILA